MKTGTSTRPPGIQGENVQRDRPGRGAREKKKRRIATAQFPVGTDPGPNLRRMVDLISNEIAVADNYYDASGDFRRGRCGASITASRGDGPPARGIGPSSTMHGTGSAWPAVEGGHGRRPASPTCWPTARQWHPLPPTRWSTTKRPSESGATVGSGQTRGPSPQPGMSGMSGSRHTV